MFRSNFRHPSTPYWHFGTNINLSLILRVESHFKNVLSEIEEIIINQWVYKVDMSRESEREIEIFHPIFLSSAMSLFLLPPLSPPSRPLFQYNPAFVRFLFLVLQIQDSFTRAVSHIPYYSGLNAQESSPGIDCFFPSFGRKFNLNIILNINLLFANFFIFNE